jgi:hypothetical protein
MRINTTITKTIRISNAELTIGISCNTRQRGFSGHNDSRYKIPGCIRKSHASVDQQLIAAVITPQHTVLTGRQSHRRNKRKRVADRIRYKRGFSEEVHILNRIGLVLYAESVVHHPLLARLAVGLTAPYRCPAVTSPRSCRNPFPAATIADPGRITIGRSVYLRRRKTTEVIQIQTILRYLDYATVQPISIR